MKQEYSNLLNLWVKYSVCFTGSWNRSVECARFSRSLLKP